MMAKLLALFLPQYHEVKENNEWWGNGFTEWTNCKKGKPLFQGHNQPRIPLNENYYDLTKIHTIEEQIYLAKKYNIYGFCFYHYWFQGKLLLEKPLEIFLNNKNLDIPFCFSWANHTWANKLERKEKTILIQQTYGGEFDWEEHYNYLRKFFLDERYIKLNNKPVLVIYDAKDIPDFERMIFKWNMHAKKDGFDGIYLVNTLKNYKDIKYSDKYKFDAQFEYQPTFSLYRTYYYHIKNNLKRILYKDFFKKSYISKYDDIWKIILNTKINNNVKNYYGAYVDWDTTARNGKAGAIHLGYTPKKFELYLKKLIQKTSVEDFVFITAWNEWSEGAYLEPDEKYEYKALEAVQKAQLED